MDKLTAKEIADDVQQTFENVTNEYRNLLEQRIIAYAHSFIETRKDNIENRKAKFISDVSLFRHEYSDEMLIEFVNYWSEHSPNGKKMKFEMQKVFDISRRLATWNKNSKQFNKNGNGDSKSIEQQIAEKIG
jgi:hypothetical protein